MLTSITEGKEGLPTDKYQKAVYNMTRMSKDGRLQEMRKLQQMCTCTDCPSYNDCLEQKEQALFCMKGASECGLVEAGCICNSCPAAKEMGLTHQYYCMNGSEEDIRKV